MLIAGVAKFSCLLKFTMHHLSNDTTSAVFLQSGECSACPSIIALVFLLVPVAAQFFFGESTEPERQDNSVNR